MYFYGFFQTDVLINFLILLRSAETVTWKNLVPAKQDPGSTKKEPHLTRMKLVTFNRRI